MCLDIADCAVAILSEPVEKHDRCVYEMATEILNNEQRAAIFTKVLGKTISYEEQPLEDFYNMCTGFGLPHSFAYNFLSPLNTSNQVTTPQLSILINRPLHTLEDWLKENVEKFQ